MPLALDLKLGDKIIINGAVIENSGHGTQILIHNEAAILRGKEIMVETEANTPATRAYFALQCAYIFPSSRQSYLQAFDVLLTDYVTAAPSAGPIVKDIVSKLSGGGSLYGALKTTRKLLTHEKKLMNQFKIDVSEKGYTPIVDEDEKSAAPRAGSKRTTQRA